MRRRGIGAVGGGALALVMVCGLANSVRADDRTAAKIVGEINGVEMPQLAPKDRGNQKAARDYMIRRQAAMERKAALIGELYAKFPSDPSLVQLLPERWGALLSMERTADEATGEIDRTIARSTNPKLVNEALLLKVLIAFRKAGPNPKLADLLPLVDDYTKRFPDDPRGADMLTALTNIAPDPTTKALLTNRVARNYPTTEAAKSLAAVKASEERQKNALGKPFPLDFRDAIGGKPINPATLKGKVVVVDFWATWCGPCVAELPTMKALYAAYKDKGVEFVGVSLDAPRDQGGFDKLKKFVEDSKIEWPQYYEGADGKPSAVDFAQSWAVLSIPAVFVLDAEGNLAATDARGKLETLIPELLKKAGHPVEPSKL